MSEIINNREQPTLSISKRQKILNELFWGLYNGKNIEEIEAQFDQEIGKVTVEEVAKISELQRQILEQKNLPRSVIERLSAAHMAILQGKIEDKQHPEDEPGHPIHTFKLENRELEKLIQSRLLPHLEQFSCEDLNSHRYKLLEDYNLLLDIDKHYVRKEQLLFPYLEKYGINGPSVNMWRMDDYIRDAIKESKRKLIDYNGKKQDILEQAAYIINQVNAMIYREETILFPMSLDQLTEDEWIKIAHESDQIGYCLTSPAGIWKPERKKLDENTISEGYIKLETGFLSLKQLELILNHLPVDVTFIDADDVVRYFSNGKERIFARTKAVIGRTVQNCHPPKSAHVVKDLLQDFKSGKKDTEDFWIKFRDQYIYIRYFAVRDENNQYVGTLEFTQNIDPIQAITGEKRILS